MAPPCLPSLEESVAARVVRRENYLTALVASGLLSLHVPLPASPPAAAAMASLLHAAGALLGCHVYIDSGDSSSDVRGAEAGVSDSCRGRGRAHGGGHGAPPAMQGGVAGSEGSRAQCEGGGESTLGRGSAAGDGAAEEVAAAAGKAAGGGVVRVTGFSRVLEWVLLWCLLEPMMDRWAEL